MGLLKKAKNQQAYAKIGIFGFPGSGKTHTAMLLAQGIAKKTGSKNIGFFDTETGSDWWVNRMSKGLDLYVSKSVSFSDLLQILKEAPGDSVDILVIDSITHVWRSLVEAYQAKFNKNDLTMMDWNRIKQQWANYTRAFLNSPIHIIVCGRGGYTYDFERNQHGKLEPKKTGTKMKAEVEFEFEPSLVIEMRAEQENGTLVNYGHVKKDRSDKINGADFKMPGFQNFEPHLECLNIGGNHKGVEENAGKDEKKFKDEKGTGAKEARQKLSDKQKAGF
jgi:hypothetical protein